MGVLDARIFFFRLMVLSFWHEGSCGQNEMGLLTSLHNTDGGGVAEVDRVV